MIDLCSPFLHRRDVQPRWPHHKLLPPIRCSGRLGLIVVRASSLHSSTADSPANWQLEICGAGFQPAQLQPPDVQPRWPHHKLLPPIRCSGRLGLIVVRASSLHSSNVEGSGWAAARPAMAHPLDVIRSEAPKGPTRNLVNHHARPPLPQSNCARRFSTAEMCSQDGRTTNSSRQFGVPAGWA